MAIDPHLIGVYRVETIATRNCYGLNLMLGLIVWIEALDDLLTKCIVAMVMNIYVYLSTQ